MMLFQLALLAIVLVVFRTVYKLVRLFTLPKTLAQYPRISIAEFTTYAFGQLSYEQVWREFYREKYKTSGYVMAPHFLGWQLHLCGVEIAKWFTSNYDAFYHMNPRRLGIEHGLMDVFNGVSVVLVDGKDWQRHRPIINAAFTKLKPTTAVAEAATYVIGNMKHHYGQPINIDPFMRRTMFRALLNAIFDLPELLENDRDEYFSRLMDEVFKECQNPFFLLFNWLDRPWFPGRRKYFEMCEEYDQLIRSIIEKKRQELVDDTEGDSNKSRDLLTLMLNANMDPEHSKMSDAELIGNCKALFLAGHETTATGTTLLMHLLAIHQDAQQKVREEVFRVLGAKPGELVTPTPDQQRELTYLNAAVREQQRMYPPSGQLIDRRCARDVVLPDGNIAPKDTLITLDQMAMLRSDKIWKDPDTFRPERHIGDDREGRTNTEFITFSAGKRICPGMNLATIEERVMIALCVQMFRWELGHPEEGKDIKIAHTWIVRPTNTILKLYPLVQGEVDT